MKTRIIFRTTMIMFIVICTGCSKESIDKSLNPDLYTYVPDDAFEERLINLGYDDVLDDYVLNDNIANVTELNVNLSPWNHGIPPIQNFKGIEGFVSLEEFGGIGNYGKNLDISKMTALKILNASNMGLTSLDVSQNIKLESLSVWGNNLTSLDLSNNPKLKRLECYLNNLTSLDISNNTALTYLDCGNLLSFMYGNNLTSLDVSMNTELVTLKCANNNLTNIDISNNSKLETLDCWSNQLTKLDVSNNAGLIRLYCEINLISCIQVNQNQLNNIPDWWHKDPDAIYSTNCD